MKLEPIVRRPWLCNQASRRDHTILRIILANLSPVHSVTDSQAGWIHMAIQNFLQEVELMKLLVRNS